MEDAHFSRRTTPKASKRARRGSPGVTDSPPMLQPVSLAYALAEPSDGEAGRQPRPPVQPRAEADLPHPWRHPPPIPSAAPAPGPTHASSPEPRQAPLPSAIGSPDNSPPPVLLAPHHRWDRAPVRLPPLPTVPPRHSPNAMSSPDSALDREQGLQARTHPAPSPLYDVSPHLHTRIIFTISQLALRPVLCLAPVTPSRGVPHTTSPPLLPCGGYWTLLPYLQVQPADRNATNARCVSPSADGSHAAPSV